MLDQIYCRRWKTILFASVSVSLILVTISYPETASVQPHLQTEVTDKSGLAERINKTSDPDHYNYLVEEVALEEPLCQDPKLAPDLAFSQVYVTGSHNKIYKLGEMISVTIRLHDSYNQSITRGGSVIRARMYNTTKGAFTTGMVVDHHNGTYTAYFQALWSGQSNISVQIAYTPETIRIIYSVRRKIPSVNILQATYQVNDVKETLLCHPTTKGLEYYGIRDFCNLTYDNSGMSWYCGKPHKLPLLCEDWLYTTNSFPYPKLPITDCETTQLRRVKSFIQRSLNVNVTAGRSTSPHVELPTNPCYSYNRTLLWNRQQPTGFMYERKWYLRHCQGVTHDMVLKCLENWTVVFFGDSTIRYWFKYILKYWNCTLMTENWTNGAWKKRSLCINKAHNLTAEWRLHAQPFHGAYDKNRYTKTSISRHLDEIGSEERIIAIVHMYAHTQCYHHSVFRNRIRRIRRSVENLLKRNKYANILIKGPHTFQEEKFDGHRFNDFYANIYSQILQEEFSGLYDKVTYLDQMDITDALDNQHLHPDNNVVGAMINQMLAYVCE